MNRSALAVTACAVVALSGCSSGPKILHFDKPLPTCDAFPSVMTRLGMPQPGPGPQIITSTSPVGVDCSFVPADGTVPPAVGYASIVVSRPSTEPDDSNPTRRWGTGFAADSNCDGTSSANPSLPAGATCYALPAEHTGSATVSSFTKSSGIRVTLRWTSLDASPEQLRSDTVNKANALAQAVIAML